MSNTSSPDRPSHPPMGWYPDPVGGPDDRYWDGANWTRNTRPPVVARTAEPTPAPTPAAPPMGWYPDPTHSDPEVTALERYWDGERWTRNTREPHDSPAWAAGLGAARAATPDASGATAEPQTPVPTARQWDHVTMQWRELPIIDTVKRTDDGVPLASFGRRLLGRLVDNLLIAVLVVAICFPQVRSFVTKVGDWWGPAYQDALRRVPVDTTALAADTQGEVTIIALVSLILTCMSAAFFHHRFGATPGQLLLRLRVVPLGEGEHEGGLPLSTSIRRAAGLAVMLALGQFLWIVVVLDALSMVFSARAQTLHDRLGRTQVIDAAARSRASQHPASTP